jgi:hypothetical protein
MLNVTNIDKTKNVTVRETAEKTLMVPLNKHLDERTIIELVGMVPIFLERALAALDELTALDTDTETPAKQATQAQLVEALEAQYGYSLIRFDQSAIDQKGRLIDIAPMSEEQDRDPPLDPVALIVAREGTAIRVFNYGIIAIAKRETDALYITRMD